MFSEPQNNRSNRWSHMVPIKIIKWIQSYNCPYMYQKGLRRPTNICRWLQSILDESAGITTQHDQATLKKDRMSRGIWSHPQEFHDFRYHSMEFSLLFFPTGMSMAINQPTLWQDQQLESLVRFWPPRSWKISCSGCSSSIATETRLGKKLIRL